MKITKQHKIYAAVLGIAVSAWAVDAVASGGGGAVVPHAPTAGAGVKSAAAIAGIATAGSTGPSALSARLKTFLGPSGNLPDVRDAFRPSELWEPAGVAKAGITPLQFKAAHKVTAIFFSKTNSTVVIDGTLMHVGDQLDGYRLVKVGRNVARFSLQGQAADLRIEENGPSQGD